MIWSLAILFVLMNLVAFFHARKFTHFSVRKEEKTKDAQELTLFQKLKALAFGIDNPRPVHSALPQQAYETIVLQSNKRIECWYIKAENPKGTIILFHGYSSDKSLMIDRSNEFLKLGYNTFLVDFMGSGGSEGNQTTIGVQEAMQVKTCYEYLVKQGEANIYIFATSMGAVSTLKAFHDDVQGVLRPKGLILECPFGTMYKTTTARFKNMGVPSFPMAGLLVFWGGLQNNFWAFGHKPIHYAKSVNVPVLLLYGEKDQNVSRAEVDEIYANLQGPKQFKTYPQAKHESYLLQYRKEWVADVAGFLSGTL